MSAATMAGAAHPERDARVARALGRRRRVVDRFVRVLCWIPAGIGLFFLASILLTLIMRGIGGLSLSVHTGDQAAGLAWRPAERHRRHPDPDRAGHADRHPDRPHGRHLLSEHAAGSKLGDGVRFVSDVLLSASSILIGLFVYQILVNPFNGFSGWAGSVALEVIVIPIVVRTTEDIPPLIPTALREAAVALGAPKWKSIVFVCYRAALDGILTGVLLAIARIAGETAPRLFTSLGNLNWSVNLSQPMSSLPVTIYQYAGAAFEDWVQLAWVGALLITFGVLALNIVARVALRRRT